MESNGKNIRMRRWHTHYQYSNNSHRRHRQRRWKNPVALGIIQLSARNTGPAFKVGPDFMTRVTHPDLPKGFRNLDSFIMGEKGCRDFMRASADADFSVIEGVRSVWWSWCNRDSQYSHVANILDVPVLLVSMRMEFAKSCGCSKGFLRVRYCQYPGIILNNMGSESTWSLSGIHLPAKVLKSIIGAPKNRISIRHVISGSYGRENDPDANYFQSSLKNISTWKL